MKYLLKTNKNPKTNFQCAGVHAHTCILSVLHAFLSRRMCGHVFMCVGGYMWIQVHVAYVCAHRGKKPSWVLFPRLWLPCYKSYHSLAWNSSIRLDWQTNEPWDLPGSVSSSGIMGSTMSVFLYGFWRSLRSLYSCKLCRLICLPSNLHSSTVLWETKCHPLLGNIRLVFRHSAGSWVLPDGLNALIICSDGLTGADLELNLQPPGFCLISSHFWAGLATLSLLDPKPTACPLQPNQLPDTTSSILAWISCMTNLPQYKCHTSVLHNHGFHASFLLKPGVGTPRVMNNLDVFIVSQAFNSPQQLILAVNQLNLAPTKSKAAGNSWVGFSWSDYLKHKDPPKMWMGHFFIISKLKFFHFGKYFHWLSFYFTRTIRSINSPCSPFTGLQICQK